MRNTPLRAFAKSSPINKKTGGINILLPNKGYMKAPYRDPKSKGPREDAKDLAYHGYKNFPSNIEKKEDARGVTTNIKMPKVFKDGSKNRTHYHKKK